MLDKVIEARQAQGLPVTMITRMAFAAVSAPADLSLARTVADVVTMISMIVVFAGVNMVLL